MSTETVTLGCRLPNGYVLEVGYSVEATVGGKRVTQYSKADNYQRFELVGTNANFRRTRLRLPATLNVEPYINKGVPKDLWEAWKKAHPRAWILTSGNVFEVKDAPAEVAAALLDAAAKPVPFAPLDPSKKITVGKDTVETAKFDE